LDKNGILHSVKMTEPIVSFFVRRLLIPAPYGGVVTSWVPGRVHRWSWKKVEALRCGDPNDSFNQFLW